MRRVLLLLVLLSAAGFIAIRFRERTAPVAASEPTWPPITRRPEPPPVGAVTERPADGAVSTPAPAWKPANADGTMPDGYPIKAKNQSMIFHVPGGRFYDRTRAERCYATEAAAIADGFRRSKT
jgi:hypothetical protein